MSQTPQDYRQMSPERLVSGFAKSRILSWVVVALFVHVMFIGATSIGYIRDTWIDPEGAAARKEAALAASATKRTTPANGDTNRASAASVTGSRSDARLLEERKDAPVVQRITEAAKTNEIPKQPGDLGISIDDTNPR